jgi:hypothetical protein
MWHSIRSRAAGAHSATSLLEFIVLHSKLVLFSLLTSNASNIAATGRPAIMLLQRKFSLGQRAQRVMLIKT